jgi:hypothetical protein
MLGAMSTTATTKTLRSLPIPQNIAIEARETGRDRFGHDLPVYHSDEPCRVCLRISQSAEDFILLSYQPLPDRNPYAEIGPIFVHAQACPPYSDTTIFPSDFLGRRLVLRAYGHDGEIVTALVAEPFAAPESAAKLFEDDRVVEIHVRHQSYTCFDFKIVRGDD